MLPLTIARAIANGRIAVPYPLRYLLGIRRPNRRKSGPICTITRIGYRPAFGSLSVRVCWSCLFQWNVREISAVLPSIMQSDCLIKIRAMPEIWDGPSSPFKATHKPARYRSSVVTLRRDND